MPEPKTKISRVVVVATYNERMNLEALVHAVLSAVPDARLIVVDDNSPDGSPGFLRELAEAEDRLLPIIREKKDGYGGAMLTGFQKALELKADQIATLDADFSHAPAVLPQMFKALDTADVALGSRYAGGVRVLNWHPSRLLLSLFANRYVIGILNLPVADATSGYRAYRRVALESIVGSGIRSVGSSSVYARWRTIDAPTTGTVAEVPIPSDILPGEATSMTLTLQAPPDPGNYELEIGISAARIGPLSRYGAESTTLTVTTITP